MTYILSTTCTSDMYTLLDELRLKTAWANNSYATIMLGNGQTYWAQWQQDGPRTLVYALFPVDMKSMCHMIGRYAVVSWPWGRSDEVYRGIPQELADNLHMVTIWS